ncbi:hypothetical protein HRM2_43820 [Desulforapulum autotrophicum HRM2]|uniref:Phage ABA sandwich domain-containing protein n=1 Tax=Desulforapulum autotrophicum (strain ATCC 43914 / DSM 3382 / VKM B-1955 / HRM2) TaxID=177437 RepID=C0QE17_DESAH|nr:hypothetical protein [Desulforapulum autotrophicum]ACN17438.1 hypothetical protein HRM2_43820 [Desulforapulum autotrophicum HRM2]
MDRDTILALEEAPLLDIVGKNFNVKLGGLRDEEYLTQAWRIMEILVEKGWSFDMRLERNLKRIDGYKFDNGPGTIFAQHGSWPYFDTMCEGICKTCLVALLLTEGVKTD